MQKRMTLLLIVSLCLMPTAFATNWQNIKTFSSTNGTEGYYTTPFNVPGDSWRIAWTYTASAQTSGAISTFFSVWAYSNGSNTLVATISQEGVDQTNGISYVQGKGEYYLKINVVNTLSYTVTVEYDSDYVAPQGISLGLVIAIALTTVAIIAAAIVILKRRKKQPQATSRKDKR
jgi:hypothetical protein